MAAKPTMTCPFVREHPLIGGGAPDGQDQKARCPVLSGVICPAGHLKKLARK
jgi:hypothetical protein